MTNLNEAQFGQQEAPNWHLTAYGHDGNVLSLNGPGIDVDTAKHFHGVSATLRHARAVTSGHAWDNDDTGYVHQAPIAQYKAVETNQHGHVANYHLEPGTGRELGQS